LEDTAHCNHFSRNVEGYVGRVRGMWEGGKVGDEERVREGM